MNQDDFEKLRNQRLIEKVAEAFADDSDNHPELLEQLGFEFFDDESEKSEQQEEKIAQPQNARQQRLVDYFEGHTELSETQLEDFLSEKEAEEPNYALMRRYFKQGNEQLLQLLRFALTKQATRTDLLHDLYFFHLNRNIQIELIHRYLQACELERDIEHFSSLVEDFRVATRGINVDVLQQLSQAFSVDTAKGQKIRKIKAAMNA